MQTQNGTITDGKPLMPLTNKLKMQIVHHMRLVPLNTAWGFAVKDFLENNAQTDKDWEELLYELRSDIHDGPGTMEQVLGSAYRFFYQLGL